MGGIGKTELVLQYAMKHFEQGTYPGGICWLRARDQEIATQILGYAQAQLGLTIPEQLDLAGQISYCWRNWSEGDALIVLEDVTAYKLVAPYLPPADPRFKLLLTTRLKLGSTVKDFPVEELDEGSAIELLVSFVGQERIQSELDDAKGLCRWVGYLPLGLELIGRFLAKKLDWSLSRLQGQLETKRLAANALLNAEAGMTAQLGIIAALELSWHELNESEQALACLLGLFAVAPIPWKLVEQCCGAIDPDDLEESRDEGLISHSLLKRMREGSYQLHQIVQEYFRVKLQQISDQGQGQKKSFCRIMVEVAKSIDDTPTIEQIERVRDAIPHLEEVANEWASTFSDNDLIWPFIGIILFYKSQFAYHTSIFWGERFLQLAKERFTEEHSEFAYGLGYLADIYRIQGNYDKAEILNNQALKIREHLFGENHPQVANSFNKLAAVFCDQGRLNEAEALYEKASKIIENIFGENHFEVITSTNNLAVLYVNQGRYHEAEPLLTKVLEVSKKLFGEAHPEVVAPTSNLAALYRNLGEYQNAELFHKLVITLKEDLFGKDHPKVATSLNNLAILYMDQNRPNDAEPLYERALKIGKDSLGEEHSEVATTINNLAHCYYTQGRTEEAQKLYKQALDIKEKLLGKDHPDIAFLLSNLAKIYFDKEKYENAETLYLRALEIRKTKLGENHPDVAKIQWSLGTLYQKKGKYSEAEALYHQALVIAKDKFGPNNLMTKSIQSWLKSLPQSSTKKSKSAQPKSGFGLLHPEKKKQKRKR